ncbi:TetR/AcrR family transcriptional regulator [Roseinatronobacter sp. S2]|uniref:TetR/AcrR family transcriptional regulator n=1 Tax=Roseinatronobacter sp. S2 TaxID=3035471 RepID=UPI0024102D2E|nr:TetR/AcrR family transcriptional regulator [Roseinatronobacter sp. S2]WFE75330.1 TetR/AcrR family transcriptional regulator [Roseinatronobacter sp. S2]
MKARGRPRTFDRQEALRKAMEVFWSRGYEHSSLSDLTVAMGINSPSLYAAFGNKEELFREALELYSKTEGGGIWSGVATAPTARIACEVLLRSTAEAFAQDDRRRGCMIVLSAPQAEGSTPSVCDDLSMRRRETTMLLEKRLERAVHEHELQSGTDYGVIAAFIATVQHGMSIQARDGASRERLLGIARCAMAAWESLMVMREYAPPPASDHGEDGAAVPARSRTE